MRNLATRLKADGEDGHITRILAIQDPSLGADEVTEVLEKAREEEALSR